MSIKLSPIVAPLLAVLFLSACSQLFYQPNHWKYHGPEDFRLSYEEDFRQMQDGSAIHYWLVKRTQTQAPARGLIIFFHGNGMNLSNHLPNLIWVTEHGYDLLLWDYRGYGRSQGRSTHETSYRDSLEILQWAVELKQKRKYRKLVAYGQSLGGMILGRAIADFTSVESIDWLVIDSSFMSYQAIARDRLSSVWITWPFSWMAHVLLSDRWAVASLNHFPAVKTLFIHSEQDQVVPFKFGQQYFEHWQTSKKYWWTLKEGGHIETFYQSSEALRNQFLNLINTDV